MQLRNPILNCLAQRDTLHEIIRHLRPLETVIAWLYCQGRSTGQIAEHLHCTDANISRHMAKATARLSARIDGARVLLHGRDHRFQDQLHRPEPDADYRPAQLARELDVSPETVKRWCRQGRFPNAYQQPRGRKCFTWRIPAGDLDTFTPPQRGGDHRSAAYRARQQAN